jgi:pimeloyl-ACP methyl ester carboxylesterase
VWEPLTIPLERGAIYAERIGAQTGPLVVCVHGISANLYAFRALAPALSAGGARRVVAIDLRGRGASEATARGTYGIESHARDVLAVAEHLDVDTFHLVGWSMGAVIGLQIAGSRPAAARLGSLAMIDHIGRPGPAAGAAVKASLDRLDDRAGSAREYSERLRSEGLLAEPLPFWEAVLAHEYGPHHGRSPATSKAACLEDLADLRGRDWRSLWPTLTMPSTLVRCRAELAGDLFVPATELASFREEADGVEVVEVDSDHYTAMTDERTASAVAALLERAG